MAGRTPLVFLIDADSRADDDQLQRIRRLLAMRGDAPYLGVVAPGSLRIYRIALDSKTLRQAQVRWDEEERCEVYGVRTARQRASTSRDHEPRLDFQCRPEPVERSRRPGSSNSKCRTRTRFRLSAARSSPGSWLIGACCRMTCQNRRQRRAFSISARSQKRPPTGSTPTFNGDLLPLSEDTFDRLPAEGYRILGDVLRRAPDGQLFLGWKEKVGQP